MPILPHAVEEIKTVRLRTEPQRDQDTATFQTRPGTEAILQWALFLVGDATDEIIASFPPSIMN
jgi:hypothetical protein